VVQLAAAAGAEVIALASSAGKAEAALALGALHADGSHPLPHATSSG
jgi:NADPH:quinone reductase-like Zn-dependent oxidoreductase